MRKYKIKRDNGFTIIEVMIVLAIAALIMLIVFLAVPALQASARNTSRKNDASRLATAVSDFTSNANGQLPCTNASGVFQTSSTDAATVLTSAGKLGQLTFSGGSACVSTATPTANEFTITNKTGVHGALTNSTATDNTVEVYEGAVCDANLATNVGADARQAAMIYPVENGSGNSYTWSCIQAM